ncbi:MAG: hypothetical protein FJZ10_01390 [Candidatus Omnitrophica bacterium]|nr:hypothetical protein [Candidatus Omnitrophota bacterium]
MDWNLILAEPIKEMLSQAATFVPNLLGALIILLVGWIFAKVLKDLMGKILSAIRFDVLARKAGIAEILTKGGVRLTFSEILSALVYWLVMVIVLVLVTNVFGLTIASRLIEGVISYIPRVIAALFVLVIAMFLGTFVSGIVRTTSLNANLPNPEFLSGLGYWAIVIFGATIAIGQLGIATVLVSTTFNIFFGAVCLALALAFGLGGREAAGRFIDEMVKKYSRR